jgi:hypothetical protein
MSDKGDIIKVRGIFMELLRERTPDHPWLKSYDAATPKPLPPDADALMATICDECPRVWQWTCACNGWCARTGENLPEPVMPTS